LCLQSVGEAADQRRLRTDDHEIVAFAFDVGDESIDVLGGEVVTTGQTGDAGVARCTVEFVEMWTAVERPSDGVLPPSATDE
jgi:hypothetical protein